MRKRSVVAISVIAVAALVVALAPSADEVTTPANVHGQLVHLTQTQDCTDGDQTCARDLTAIAISESGERIEGRFYGTAQAAEAGTDQVSPSWGYTHWTYPDGSTIVARSEDATKIDRAGNQMVAGQQTCIFGTGRFADVDCTIDWSHTAQPQGLFPGAYKVTFTPKATL
ncbi:MAG: hypothetical protein AAF495_26090 [Pseudomonadota bacterium]